MSLYIALHCTVSLISLCTEHCVTLQQKKLYTVLHCVTFIAFCTELCVTLHCISLCHFYHFAQSTVLHHFYHFTRSQVPRLTWKSGNLITYYGTIDSTTMHCRSLISSTFITLLCTERFIAFYCTTLHITLHCTVLHSWNSLLFTTLCSMPCTTEFYIV